MPVLVNKVHEAYARNRAKGLRITEALEAIDRKNKKSAFPNRNVLRTTASQYNNRRDIKARIKEIQGAAAKRAAITVEDLLKELEDTRLGAIAADQWTAALGATVAKAKLLGFYTDDKTVNINLIPKPMAEPTKELELSADEWARRWQPKIIGPTNGHA